jgi:hypothetical protein
MAQAAVRQVQLGLNALFFASPRTDEKTIAFVTLDEWRALWREIDRRLARYERWPALYSDIAAYARAKHRTQVVRAHADGAMLTCELQGSPDVPLFLSVWTDAGDHDLVGLRYQQVAPFAGAERVVWNGP